jgi:hypothetical protein
MLVASYQQYHSQGLEMLGVSLDDAVQEKQIEDFVKERNVRYPILLGNREVAGASKTRTLLSKASGNC